LSKRCFFRQSAERAALRQRNQRRSQHVFTMQATLCIALIGEITEGFTTKCEDAKRLMSKRDLPVTA
jgi:hypothetical protein